MLALRLATAALAAPSLDFPPATYSQEIRLTLPEREHRQSAGVNGGPSEHALPSLLPGMLSAWAASIRCLIGSSERSGARPSRKTSFFMNRLQRWPPPPPSTTRDAPAPRPPRLPARSPPSIRLHHSKNPSPDLPQAPPPPDPSQASSSSVSTASGRAKSTFPHRPIRHSTSILSSPSTRHGPPSESRSPPTTPIHKRFSRKTPSPPTGSQRKSSSTTIAPWSLTRPEPPVPGLRHESCCQHKSWQAGTHLLWFLQLPVRPPHPHFTPSTGCKAHKNHSPNPILPPTPPLPPPRPQPTPPSPLPTPLPQRRSVKANSKGDLYRFSGVHYGGAV